MERASEKRNAINDGLVALRSFPLYNESGMPLDEAHLPGLFILKSVCLAFVVVVTKYIFCRLAFIFLNC